jgi:hypothetical protein
MFGPVHVFMKSTRSATRLAACALALVGLTACKSEKQKGPQASGGANASPGASASSPKLPLAAMNALDEGNKAYRAKQLDVALAKYREAAVVAPQHAAPWFGIYMAANEMKNTALADSAMVRVKSLSADPAALDAHATVTSANGGLDTASRGMPAGHPATKLVMPSGRADSVKRTRM